MMASWPDPVELRLGKATGGQLRIRMRIGDGRVPVVVIERFTTDGGRYSVSPVIEVPAHRCGELGDVLLKFAKAIPDKAP